MTPASTILEREATRLHTTVSRLMVHSRLPRLVRHRQNIMLTLYTESDASYPDIGRMMNRNHSTIIHGVRKAAQRKGMTYADVLAVRAKNRNPS